MPESDAHARPVFLYTPAPLPAEPPPPIPRPYRRERTQEKPALHYTPAPLPKEPPPPIPRPRGRFVRTQAEKDASVARARLHALAEEELNALEHVSCRPAEMKNGLPRRGVLKVVVNSPYGVKRTALYTSRGKWCVESDGSCAGGKWNESNSVEEFVAAFAPAAYSRYRDALPWEKQLGPRSAERRAAAHAAERAYLLAHGYVVPHGPPSWRTPAFRARLEPTERRQPRAPRAEANRGEPDEDETAAAERRHGHGRGGKAPERAEEQAERGAGAQEGGDAGRGHTGTGGADADHAAGGARADAVGVADTATPGRTPKRPDSPTEAGIGGVDGPSASVPNRARSGGGRTDTSTLSYVHGDRLPISRYARYKKAGRARKWVSRRTCGARFRERVREAFPGLDRDPAYWAFLELLLFSSSRFYDRPTLIPHEIIADLCGFDPHYGGFRSGEFLDVFRRDVLPGFVYKDYDYEAELVREVADDGLPPWLLDALADEMAVRPHELVDRVYFASGFSFDRKRDPKRLRELDLRDAHAADLPTTPDQRFVQAYLHGLSARSFSFLNDSFERAHTVANAIDGAEARAQALKALQRIFVQPLPFYSAVRNSYRLFSIVGGLQQLASPVRKALMAGCWDLDADALHLAIMARAWEIPQLQAFLEEHGAAAIWRSLTAHVARVCHGRGPEGVVCDPDPLSEDEHKAYKAAIKHGVYALGYGGGPATIAEQVAAHDEGGLFDDYDGVVDALKGHELLGAVFEAKARMLERIKADSGMEGAYGWIPMQRGRGPLTVLAMASSSYEFALMRPVFDVAAEHPDLCSILLYQFDGVTIRFRREADTAWLIAKMQDAFKAKAREFGIRTQLSPERL